ncbi:MAG TPA: ABC transporter ATP-binding protein [Thermodesulfobacteriota bacterium]|nr:ABC transporter ATP-binding protein [Thermodesulfobacteriota bacterium]
MNRIAIRVVGLSKRFRIDRPRPGNATREFLENVMRAPFRSISSIIQQTILDRNGDQARNDKYVWALKEVTFEVRRGESLGIIGSNGAGKSVLLKILSRVTKPTEGRAEIYGKIGSMLEVGTGFHPELTGRENIYLSGAILGMKKSEINRKFDEIVAFSEVEKFLDTPIKHFSSGMNVRLAFAIASHLEPEIMLMDEVLAVGDDAFKQKCLNKMKEAASEGRTVLFVSHDMKAVEELCDRAVFLRNGRIVIFGDTHEVVSQYLAKEPR